MGGMNKKDDEVDSNQRKLLHIGYQMSMELTFEL